ncbi:aromatic-ring-hydroxylating dioxygenase subunit beta [Rhodopila globiformis]|jgi:anthranilate 1,2-dioxygenase small subunit/terephthalate 1,2-dioxygenase oxygenase component beta subunit|uniref:Terephthalate 1,2-dioxygenase n=1 Tax=Rhodopila globiformis TaxID=1071 RepID=A0A2S6N6Y1_RHOGL|nr:aromatic-ring-hydroxylating dioxygenase subunit beta [Rhodopila globiformis]PPQ30363.1 terephthalate 1,2-dioxygenase [Rhodopila globiformis]
MTGPLELAALNAACAAAIDANRLEAWPDFFHDRCLYKVTTADNFEKGHQAGLIYADSRAMLHDRVAALRQANIYERQRYRHVLGLPLVTADTDGLVSAETSFVVVRTMRDGQMMVFAAGVYRDEVRRDETGAWRYAERIVVCDSQRIDTLLAIPL